METSRLPKFSENFAKLRGDMSQAQFAEKLGISRATVGLYENGSRLPDALVLKNIAEKCGISVDYLVGLVPEPTNNPDMRAMCEYTGLSSASLENIKRIRNSGPHMDVLNTLLSERKTLAILGDLSLVVDAQRKASQILSVYFQKYFPADHNSVEDIGLKLSDNLELGLFEVSEQFRYLLESLWHFRDTLFQLDDLVRRADEMRVQPNNKEISMSKMASLRELRELLKASNLIKGNPSLSARNIPSTAVEAQSDAPGGDPSPIEERQDGKHKEDKR